ncbi:MAG: glycosyltransferase, partial [Vicinamibacterales bacterium]|nr:glycosyltransferase [Vicinamibacterales bacterium]
MRLAIPDGVSGPVLVTFRTTRPGGAPLEAAPAFWGDPCLEWSRSLLGLARIARANVRQVGWRGAVSKFVDYTGHDEERARFRRWVELNTSSAAALAEMASAVEGLAHQPLISIITPVYNTDPQWLVACIESVRRQAYPNWELCLADDASTSAETEAVLKRYAGDTKIKIVRLDRNQHISAASNAALACATGEFVAMLDHDDELSPDALFEVVKCLNDNPTADFVYSDEDKIDTAGERCEPYFKPDWSPEMFRSFMYTNHLMVLRRSVVDAAGGFRVGFEGSQDYDLALRVIERTDRVVHVPKVLYHWRKIPGSAAAEVEAKPWALKAARRALEEHLRRTGVDAQVVPGMLTGL